MQLGVDFGTTRTIVARADRGNYPVVAFADVDGDYHEHFPSLVALRDGAPVFGFAAEAAARAGEPYLRSVKRVLGEPGVNADTRVAVGGRHFPLLDLLAGLLRALHGELRERSDVAGELAAGEELRAVVSVPAHAHGAQRFLTLEAFRLAAGAWTLVAALADDADVRLAPFDAVAFPLADLWAE